MEILNRAFLRFNLIKVASSVTNIPIKYMKAILHTVVGIWLNSYIISVTFCYYVLMRTAYFEKYSSYSEYNVILSSWLSFSAIRPSRCHANLILDRPHYSNCVLRTVFDFLFSMYLHQSWISQVSI